MIALETSLQSAALPITLDAVTKSYDRTEVIPPLSATFRAGEFTVVLGPSGCGKSTILQMLAGLEKVSGGTISIGERQVQDLEPKHRGCAMVFQNYALYPHMNVGENIAYSLKVAGVSRALRRERVAAVATMLSLESYLDRRPSQLSGGQRQRVAIGRAIIREPSVLLFDEPLSNLDAKLRHDMRIELAGLHRRIGATTVFVTHDQVEAMTLADRIMILNKGHIEQFDTPRAVYRNPASVFVAQFIGAPPMNILSAQGDGTMLRLPSGEPLLASERTGEVLLGIRPEDIQMTAADSRAIPVRARIVYREDLGSHEVLSARLPSGTTLNIATTPGVEPAPDGDEISLFFPSRQLHVFDAETGQSLANTKKDS